MCVVCIAEHQTSMSKWSKSKQIKSKIEINAKGNGENKKKKINGWNNRTQHFSEANNAYYMVCEHWENGRRDAYEI